MAGRNVCATLLISVALIPALASAQSATSPPEAGSSPSTPSQSTQPAPLSLVQLGVTFEGYYQYNWNRPFDRINLLRAYDTRANTFGIQQAGIVLESAPDLAANRRFGARVDLQFGQATETVQGSSANEPRPNVYRNIWQAYGTYVFDVGRA